MKAVVDLPAAPHSRRPVVAIAAVLILLFLGMSLAAAGEATGRCQTTDTCVDVGGGHCLDVGGGQVLADGNQITLCELSLWGVHVPLPETVADILGRIGVRLWS
jgi:hypothetical protein